MSSISTPTAIVLGLALAGAFVGAGIYFALRPREAAAPMASGAIATTPRANATADDGSSVVAANVNGGEGPSATSEAPATTSDEVKRALDAQHAHLVETCWAPAFAKNPKPATTTITFTLSFGPDGKPLGRGLREDVATARPAVTQCIADAIVLPSITPRGVRARAEYELTLP